MSENGMNNTQKEIRATAGAQPVFSAGQPIAAAPPADTEYTKRFKEQFGFFGPASFVYACIYAFCMFHNGSGVTFPFFIAVSLLYLCLCLSKLEITLKKGSTFYMISMMLFSVSTFCTDDGRIIAMNKTAIFLLMMSLLLKQFLNTSGWKLGKYLGSIIHLCFASLGNMGSPVSNGMAYYRNRKKNGKVWYAFVGFLIAVPLLIIVLLLLSGADAVFREMTDRFLEGISPGNIINVLLRVTCLFFGSYMLISFLCKKTIREEVKDKRRGEPIIAITITTLLSIIYLLFSGIQIVYLFLGMSFGKGSLPEGYTYAMYAREGFFQLLVVSILNLVIVLMCLSYFRESKLLKLILTVMSLCTFIMIASSAMRMIIYIRYYYMTFLRIFVLWSLALLTVLFVGVVINILKERFPLFGYSMVAVTLFYLVLSFSHPDYIIASINVANAPRNGQITREVSEEDFFQNKEYYQDYAYLSRLSADAAPVLIPYMQELGYDMNAFYVDNIWTADDNVEGGTYRFKETGFGFYYLEKLQKATENFSLRTYNVSRHMALKKIEQCAESSY